MESISSLSQTDPAIFTELAAPIDVVHSRNAVERIEPETERDSGETYTYERSESTLEDLNEYYSRLAAENYIPSDYSNADPLTTASSGVRQSAENLQNAMIDAIQQGMSIEHACNIRCAKAAYEANIRVLKSTIEISV